MKIWEPKPPGTPWATPGLLRDDFILSSWGSGILVLDLTDRDNAAFRNIGVLRTEIFQTTNLLVSVFAVET
jgi:hypothetical protein